MEALFSVGDVVRIKPFDEIYRAARESDNSDSILLEDVDYKSIYGIPEEDLRAVEGGNSSNRCC